MNSSNYIRKSLTILSGVLILLNTSIIYCASLNNLSSAIFFDNDALWQVTFTYENHWGHPGINYIQNFPFLEFLNNEISRLILHNNNKLCSYPGIFRD